MVPKPQFRSVLESGILAAPGEGLTLEIKLAMIGSGMRHKRSQHPELLLFLAKTDT